MKVIAMIPARYAATRFPGKLMQELNGMSVIRRTYEATVATQLFDEVFVVTDSPIIYDEIVNNGGKAIRSKEQHECGSDRIAEAVADMDVDIVVNVQGDEPFTKKESLEKVLEVFKQEDAEKIDLASLMTPISIHEEITDPNTVKVVVDQNNFALYFSRSPIPYPRDQETKLTYYKHKGIYAFRKSALLDFYHLPMRAVEAAEKIECLRYLEYGKTIKMIESNAQGIEIDTPEDLQEANEIWTDDSKKATSKPVKKTKADPGFKNFPMVPKVVFGKGSFDQLPFILNEKRAIGAPFIFLVDSVFENETIFLNRIHTKGNDKIIFISAEEEPSTAQVDALVEKIKNDFQLMPSGIVGIGGGTMLDLAKAVAILLKNPGKSSEYQGWDLVKRPALYHVGIPTISGTGAEVSRTTVLTGPEKKLGINSDFTPFDQVILDYDLTKTVEKDQWFYTGMDCFIHCVESLNGTYLNTFSESYGEKAYELCLDIFLNDSYKNEEEARAKLMMASWHGGMSIAYSQVGVAHALSYGLSYLLGTHHGIGNCIVFDKLEDFYPKDVKIFKQMVEKHQINIPQNICKDLSDEQINIMIDVSMQMDPLWENALGNNWREKMTRERMYKLYKEM
ncbi:3-deoxy-manno-octulosonate cytidylyltransferase [Haloflavibacter putidus]|uniref:3-deoxy-manno-octulosonate cytidylyltransferase n=1 Tax=Haloflavibacter putidus TaxID=2576776 RepID=A0A507ZR98_9FLAO|nr:3-deoxy-manno-octulosonate cytidylyltransferase [Haloflavibacter putidus]